MSDYLILYVTMPDRVSAETLARALISDRLAACVNIHAEMSSVYRWEGDVASDREIPMIVKTSARQAPAARDRIITLHPFDCPCVIALPIERDASAPAFLDWIDEAMR